MRLRVLFTLLAGVLVLAACGVPTQDEPRELSADGVPFDLLEPGSTTTATTIAGDGRTAAVEIFLVGAQRLAATRREVPAPPEAEEVVSALLEGPTEEELDRGLTSAIPDGTELIDLGVSQGVLTMNLSEEINTVQAEVQTQAIAQLVFTATGLPRVNGVRFEVAGEPADVPIGDGSLQSLPVNRVDYPELDPGRAPS